MPNDEDPHLSYEKLDVYRCAIDFVALAAPVLDTLPRGYASLRDQFRRAALSIPLNIAEGAGKVQPVDRARFYAIARGSAMECGACLDVCHALELIDEAKRRAGKGLLARVVAMLTKMCR